MSESFDPQVKAEFDGYAERYQELHARNVAISGESPEYFAAYKRQFLERLLGPAFHLPVLDFGCGIGNLTRLLASSFAEVAGYDPSSESIALARKRAPAARFYDHLDAVPRARFGAAVLANVLHHVPVGDRAGLTSTVAKLVAPGGRLVVFEHNPYNPVTRRVVRACEFDENAVLLRPREAKRLLRGAGLAGVGLDYIVFFPRLLAALRTVEPALSWLPLGAQYAAWGLAPAAACP